MNQPTTAPFDPTAPHWKLANGSTITATPAVVCRECGPTCKYGEGDEIRPCVKCGEIIGHGAGQHTCDSCGDLCCTACSHDADSPEHPNWKVICNDCQRDHGCSCCQDGQKTITAAPTKPRAFYGRDIVGGIARERCAICKAPRSAHKEETGACPKITGGHDETYTFLSPLMVPKAKADLVAAYGLALDSIDRLQRERVAARAALEHIRVKARSRKARLADLEQIATKGMQKSGWPFKV